MTVSPLHEVIWQIADHSLWFTAGEIAEKEFPGLPSTVKAVKAYAVAEGWPDRTAPDGSPLIRKWRRGPQYHAALFPITAQELLIAASRVLPWDAHNRLTAKRLKAERERLGMSRATMAHLMGQTIIVVKRWEDNGIGDFFRQFHSFAILAEVGFDIEFIITGRVTRRVMASLSVEQTLANLGTEERHRLLLDLIAGEMAR